jgi:hypothetical protein
MDLLRVCEVKVLTRGRSFGARRKTSGTSKCPPNRGVLRGVRDARQRQVEHICVLGSMIRSSYSKQKLHAGYVEKSRWLLKTKHRG